MDGEHTLQVGGSPARATLEPQQDVQPITQEAEPVLRWPGKAAAASCLWEEMRKKFLRGKPKVLGSVQIVIALMNFSFGMIMSALVPSFSPHPIVFNMVYSLWGPMAFIISGSMSIAAGTRTARGLVNSSLGLNITSSVLAAAGIVISAVSITFLSFEYRLCNRDQTEDNCSLVMPILLGLESVVLILSVLEFSIAMSLSVFGCKLTCCNPDRAVLILQSNIPMEEIACPAPPEGHFQSPPYEELVF
ncbi:PREDICTED: membrane-spanning 4-domains subfamily A member 4A-like [Chinchilla lanigera]|uniref:membrane-spanning 4-domains subfamily A member 4A-like n=1 Tax=Chinchilla lanigera TaxID=34839 RepID=UPI00038E9A1A|nr:PREDICTED: membrane-spanning 4-domains subfamily A member 4A-like [Chinchilla lanigera]